MKTFRIVGIVVMTVLMGVGLISCTKDDDSTKEENGVVVNEKKLVKISYSASNYTVFTYDNNGRLIEAEDISNSGSSFKRTMIWGDDAIKINTKEKYNGQEYNGSYTLYLEDGLVKRSDLNSRTYTYTYNNSNRLIEWEREKAKTSIIWDGDKLVSATDEEYGHTTDMTLTYEKSCKKGHFPPMCDLIYVGHGSPIFYAHPELAGLRTTQLPASVTTIRDNNSTDTVNYSYELDKQGYISKITITEEDSEPYTYTLTWE